MVKPPFGIWSFEFWCFLFYFSPCTASRGRSKHSRSLENTPLGTPTNNAKQLIHKSIQSVLISALTLHATANLLSVLELNQSGNSLKLDQRVKTVGVVRVALVSLSLHQAHQRSVVLLILQEEINHGVSGSTIRKQQEWTYTQSGHLQIRRSTKTTYQDFPVAGSMSPVKMTLREGFERFSSRILGNDSTSRITVNWYLRVTPQPWISLLGHGNKKQILYKMVPPEGNQNQMLHLIGRTKQFVP